jgi:hypothetical protein
MLVHYSIISAHLLCVIIHLFTIQVTLLCVGKLGLVGGSSKYTGAPYYAGISALKTVMHHHYQYLMISTLSLIHH